MSTNGERQPAATPIRRRLAIGGAGLAVALGGGAYLITTQVADREGTTAAPDNGAIQQIVPATPTTSPSPSPSPVVSDVTEAPTRSATSAPARTTAAATPQRSEDSAAVRREIERARAAAAREGVPLQRPLPQKAGAGNAATTRTEPTAEGTIRISTAKADLTGQQDQQIAGDGGKRVGNAYCTQKVRFSADAQVREVPTLLLCWRMSAKRSVVTLAVSKKGTPSSAISTATIDREWAKLG